MVEVEDVVEVEEVVDVEVDVDVDVELEDVEDVEEEVVVDDVDGGELTEVVVPGGGPLAIASLPLDPVATAIPIAADGLPPAPEPK